MKNSQQLKTEGFKNIANGSVIIAFSILFYLIITILNNNFLDDLDENTRVEILRILKLCIYGIICCNIYAFFLIYYGADKLSELE
jgi:hypothetical protein